MHRRLYFALACAVAVAALSATTRTYAQQAFGRQWGGTYSNRDWERLYHYPYVFYPQNYWSNDYFKSADSLYYRYPQEMRIPVYNKQWHNYYPEGRLYHSGHDFILDVF